MSQGDLIAFQTVGQMKDKLSPFPGAEEAGILSIFRTICLRPNVCKLDVVGETFCFKKIFQGVGPFVVETQVNVNWNQFVMDGNMFSPLVKEVEKCEAILPSRDSY
jgi:hypothetical protein